MKLIPASKAAFAVAVSAAITSAYACAPDDPTADMPSAGSAGSDSGGITSGGALNAGSAGAVSGGAAPGGSPSGGANTGGGGAASSAGSGGAAGGNAGAGGGMSGGCADKLTCIDEIASKPSSFGNGGWKDSWWVTGCYKKQQHDCLLDEDATCHSKDMAGDEEKGARTVETWELGGEPGQKYKVSFSFDAVTEAKRYKDGKRDVASVVGDPHTNNPLDMFYRGGSPQFPSNYNVVKLTVYDNTDKEVAHYFMNAAPETGDLGQWENHYTFLASYKKSIVVIGGGKIRHKIQDANCHAIDNCGPALLNGETCASARKLPGASADVMLPEKYMDPRDGQTKNTGDLSSGPYPAVGRAQPFHAQAGHLKIISIEKTSDPIDMVYPDPQ